MSLEGVAGIGITKRPSQQCPDARRAEAQEDTVEQDTGPWIARKKVTALAICLVALPVLMTTVSRRDAPWTAASFWPLASTSTKVSNAEKLLGGLLVPGFNERSCLSRYHSAFYRKNMARSPSPHLIKRLREHEALQHRCGPGTEAYRAAAARLSSGHPNATDGDDAAPGACKYLVLVPYRGLGNNILAMASAFLYAVLTDRALLLDRTTSLGDIFCEPFPGASWLLPQHFPIRNLQNLTGEVPESYRHLVQSDDAAASVSRRRYVFVDLDHSCTYHDKLFFCDDERRFLHRAPWLLMRTDGYFVPALFLNPAYQEELDRLFPRKDAVFYLLAHYLFHPTNKVWGLITRFHDSYLKNSDERLGIQIRVFDGDTPFQHILDQILACTSQEHLLPDVVTQEPPHPSTTGAQSKAIVTSGWSTFGYVGHGLGGLTPWIMFRPENHTTPNPPCQRAKSMEPCMHGPPFYDCRTKHGADTGKLVPHVQHCEDMSWGLKLVHPE
ncbi:galactoside 2-alpha-L-fucosyltransferase [Setaria italica]|uniref:galactoside 2-alpha-L-fucosyltransferase n=1 Tax=Setaria italica TaxID=4555 RepID=UPI00064624D3|nr:galactoside 2-alpha-L-fucosyltransferase [Setaria italica]